MNNEYQIELTVESGPTGRENAIVSCPLDMNHLLWHAGVDGKCNESTIEVIEVEADGSLVILPSQYTRGELFWIMNGNIPSHTSRNFVVKFNTNASVKGKLNPQDVMIITDLGRELIVTQNNTEICRYKYRDVWKPFFHPIYGPNGEVTRGEVFDEENHPFHHGLWFAYGTMEADGTNLWAESDEIMPRRGMTGKMVHESFELIQYGKVFAEFRERVVYQKPDGFPFARELRTVRIYAPSTETRIFDWSIRLEEPDDIGDRNTMFCARVAHGMRIRDLNVRTEQHRMGVPLENGGIITKGNAWVDYSGPVGSGWNGIALFDHPNNPNFPLSPTATEYGLINGLTRRYPADERGGAVYLQYRAYVHDGDATAGHVNKAALDYMYPSRVSVGTLSAVE